MTDTPTVVFFPEGAYGPTNNCVGIGQVLQRHGVRVVFVVEESFAGALEAQGFEERLMRLGPPPEVEEAPGQFWKDFIAATAPEFRKPTSEQLTSFVEPTMRALVDGARYVDDRLREIIDELDPDLVVEDNVCAFPALLTHARRWARIVSCNPAELRDTRVPPVFSGLSVHDEHLWPGFRAEYDRVMRPLWEEADDFCRERGAPGLGDLEFIRASDHLNLYIYPEEVDYPRAEPLGATWHRIDTCVRDGVGEADVPADVLAGDGRLIYLSLGSLGSADTALMQRLCDALADTPHRYIVSKGPQHDEIELRDNQWGGEYLPQPLLMPRCDLVITHGGNNTTTECLHHGLPMVLLPLFWDQYDNAQRMDDLGLGVRLPTYAWEPADLTGAIDRMLADADAAARLRAISARVQADPGRVRAAELIERVARGG
ncbi:MAG: nucleotide disphospho-sugar-binding domain-containing protein [Actinomycetota bacterium]